MIGEGVLAMMRGERCYTLRVWQYRDPLSGRKTPFKWVGFCDGQRWRLFKTKADFLSAVDREPRPVPLGPHAEAAFRAETWSTFEGNRLLGILRERFPLPSDPML